LPPPDTGEDDDATDPGEATTADLLRGDALPQRADQAREIWLAVLPQNVDTVAVFRQCQPTILVTQHTATWSGFSAQEVRAALALVRVPRSRWDRVIAGVRWMEQVAAKAHAVDKEKVRG